MTSIIQTPTTSTTQESTLSQKPYSKISKTDLFKAFYTQRPTIPSLQPLLEAMPEIFSQLPLEPESSQPQQNPNWSDMVIETSTPVRPMRLVPQKRTYIPNSPFTTSGYVEEPTARVWYYLDEGNSVQGPFTSLEMDHWYDSRFFFNELLIRIHERNDFVKLIHLFGKTEIIHVYKPVPFGHIEGGGIYSGVASPNGPLGSAGPLSSAKSGKGSMYTFGYNSDITFGNNSEAAQPSEGTLSQEPTPSRTPGRSPSKGKAFTYDFMNTNMDVIQETCPQSEIGKPDSAEKKVQEARKSREEDKLQQFVVQYVETRIEENPTEEEVKPEVKKEVKEEISSPEEPKDHRFEDISTDNISNDVQPNSQEKVEIKCQELSAEEGDKKSKSTTPKNRSINEGRDSGNEAGSRRDSNHIKKQKKEGDDYKRHGEGWKEDGVHDNNAGKSKYNNNNNNNNRRKNFDEVVYYEKKSTHKKSESITYESKQNNYKDYGHVDNKQDDYHKNDKYSKKSVQKNWNEDDSYEYKNNKKNNNYNREDNHNNNAYSHNNNYKQKRASEEVEYREKDHQMRINRPNKAKGLVLYKKDDRFLDDQYERGNDHQGYSHNNYQQQGGHHKRNKSNNFNAKDDQYERGNDYQGYSHNNYQQQGGHHKRNQSNNFNSKQDKNTHTPGKQTKDHRDGKSNNNYNESAKKGYNAKGENQVQEMTIFVPKKKDMKDDLHGINGYSLNSTSASTNPEENKGYEKKNKKWDNKRQSEDNVKYQEKKKNVKYERRDSETFEMLKATSEFYSNENERGVFHDEGYLDWASPGKQPRKSSEPQPQENIGPVKMWEKSIQDKGTPAKKKIMNYEMDQDDIVSSSLGLLDLEGESAVGRSRGPSYFKNTSAHPSPNRIDKGVPLFNFTEDYIRFE